MTDHEIWKPVVGFEGSYEVSNLGRVRSLARTVASHNGSTVYQRRIRGCLLKSQRHSGGYAQIGLPDGSHLVHEIVAAAFIGPRPANLEVCHRDDDQDNNRADNLRYDVHVANCADRKANGCVVEGTLNPQAKLTEADVQDIRNLARTMKQRDVAALYGMRQGHISRIVTGKRWPHV